METGKNVLIGILLISIAVLGVMLYNKRKELEIESKAKKLAEEKNTFYETKYDTALIAYNASKATGGRG